MTALALPGDTSGQAFEGYVTKREHPARLFPSPLTIASFISVVFTDSRSITRLSPATLAAAYHHPWEGASNQNLQRVRELLDIEIGAEEKYEESEEEDTMIGVDTGPSGRGEVTVVVGSIKSRGIPSGEYVPILAMFLNA